MPGEEELAEGTLISHLVELRQRLLKAALAVIVIFLCMTPFARQIFVLVSEPLTAVLPEGSSLIAIGVASPFMTPFKTTFYVAVFVAMPFVLNQVWRFVAPALYRRERRFAVPLFLSSIFLFHLGVAFSYWCLVRSGCPRSRANLAVGSGAHAARPIDCSSSSNAS